MEYKNIIENKYNILIVIIIMLGIIIRIVSWPNGIDDINCDEAMMAINARNIANTGSDVYGTRLPVYFEAWLNAGQSSLPTYLVAIFINIFGYNLFAIRLPILLISIIPIYIIYLLSKKIFNKEVGIIVLFLTSINPWHIMQSQWNLDCNFFPHIILIAIYLLYSGIKDKKKIFIYISMFFWGLSMYCYGISIYFVPIFLLITGIYLLKNNSISIKEFILSIILYLIVSLPILGMYLINLFGLDTIKILGVTIQKFYYNSRNSDMLIFSNNILHQLKLNIICLITLIFLQNDGLIWNSIDKFGTVYLQSIIFITFGISVLIDNRKDKKGRIILLWVMISLITGLLINNVNVNRLNIIWYPMIILTGYGIYAFCNLIPHKKKIKIIIMFSYVIIFIMFFIRYYTYYQNEISQSYTFSKGLVQACKFINNIDAEKIIVSDKANTRAHYVYYRYALDYDYTKPISKEELLYYYEGNNQEMSWFNNDKKQYEVDNFDNKTKIADKVYLIKNNEKINIKNIEEYKENIFGEYTVLVRK